MGVKFKIFRTCSLHHQPTKFVSIDRAVTEIPDSCSSIAVPSAFAIKKQIIALFCCFVVMLHYYFLEALTLLLFVVIVVSALLLGASCASGDVCADNNALCLAGACTCTTLYFNSASVCSMAISQLSY